MNKALYFVAFIGILVIMPKMAIAYDFSANNAASNYNTLYYNITSDSTVEVTDYNFNNRAITGVLKIPATVTRNGHTYSVTKINPSAFNLCDYITSVIIPESIIDMGETSSTPTAFSECINITTIQVDDNNPIYDSRNNCNAIIKKAQNSLILGCKNTIIPNTVTSIGFGAFSHCRSITSISIPNSVSKLGPHSFSHCKRLKSIQLPEGLDTIGYMAFYNCDSLERVALPNSVKSIGLSFPDLG